MTQGSLILNFFEKVCRSNIYLFLISRYLIGKYLSKIIYDNDFKFIKILENNRFFKGKKLIIDIGANDGMSYKIIRKFTRKTKIVSFEPNEFNFKTLKKIEFKDKFFTCKKVALSSSKKKQSFFTPYFKKHIISQIAGLSKSGVKKRLQASLHVKDLLKKIVIKKEIFYTKKLDDYKFKPSFIKIDIEGHEYECVLGSLKTIKKYNPIIMVEYDKIVCDKIYILLKKLNYQKYIYNKLKGGIEKYNGQKIFNIFFINKKNLIFTK